MNSDYEMTPEYKKKKEKVLASNRNDKDKAKEMAKLGINEAKKNKGRNAFDAFEVATKLDPKNYAAWMYLGGLQELYEFTAEALSSYAKAANLPDDKRNNGAAREKYQVLSLKQTVQQAEVTLKKAKIIPETEPPSRARPNLSREDSLANVKRLMGMSIEEREALNERHEFTAIVIDELFAHEAKGKGESKVVQMNEEKWYRLVQELISRGRRDAAAENMVYCVRENPKKLEYWKELIELLEEVDDPDMKAAAQEAYQQISKGEQIEKFLWRRMYAEPPEDRRKGFEKEYSGKIGSAQRLIKSKRFENAESVLLEALDLDGVRYEANYFLGLLYAQQGKLEDAENYLNKAFEASPESSNAGLILAQVYSNKREFERAQETLHKLREYPKYAKDAEAFLAMVLSMMQKHEEAIAQYKVAFESSADNPQFLEGYAMSLNALGRTEETESVLLKALAIDESPTGFIALADVQLKLDKRKAAEDSAKRALKKRTMEISSVVKLANVFRKLKKISDAERLLGQVIRQDENNTDAQFVFALCHFDKKDYVGAISISKKVLELDPENYNAWRLYGGSMEVSGNGSDDEIIEAFNKALSLAPENPDGVADLGRFHLKKKKYDEAERILRKSYEMNPTHIATVMYLSTALLKLGREDEALEIATKTRDMQPESPDAEDAVTHVLVETKRWDEALASVNRTLRLNPKHEESSLHLAETYLGLGRLKEADKEVKKLMKHQKEESGPSWIVLSKVQRAMGKEKDAEKSEAKALSIDPRLKDHL